MVENEETISVAESVTAGNIQHALSLAPNATQFFQGGISAYNIGQKSRHLQINPIHALSCNCVSQQVANDMAINVCKLFLSDWGISITGYAELIPDITELYAFYAIAYKEKIINSGHIKTQAPDKKTAQKYYKEKVLRELYNLIITSKQSR